MKNHHRIHRLLLVLLFVLPGFNSMAQNVESAVRFFELVDTLQSDRPLSDALWERFLNLDGNRLFIETNGLPDTHLEQVRRKWETVFRPSNDSLLRKALGRDPLIDIYHGYRQNLPGLKDHVGWLGSVSILDSMHRRATEWLPERMHRQTKSPYVYFIMIDHNGSANPDGILNSLWASYLLDRLRPGAYGGHEMHHFLRQSKPLRPAAPADRGILWALESLLTEGTADLVDMPYWIRTDFMQSFVRTRLAESPVALRALNRELESMADGGEGKSADYFDELFGGTKGHFPGYYLARAIVDAGHGRELLRVMDDPFAFLLLYQKSAAGGERHPAFSRKAVRQIRHLKKLYLL